MIYQEMLLPSRIFFMCYIPSFYGIESDLLYTASNTLDRQNYIDFNRLSEKNRGGGRYESMLRIKKLPSSLFFHFVFCELLFSHKFSHYMESLTKFSMPALINARSSTI